MIYLIGGAPRVGKSIVAKSIAETKAVRSISTDDIQDRISATIPEKRRRELFPLPNFFGDPSENTLTPDERVKLQIIAARSLNSEIEDAIDEAIGEHHDLVIEGVHLLPERVREMIDRHEKSQIAAIFVGSVDVERVMSGMGQNANVDDWLKGTDEAVRRQVSNFVVTFSTYLRDEAKRNGLPYFERTDAFESDVRQVIDSLMECVEEYV